MCKRDLHIAGLGIPCAVLDDVPDETIERLNAEQNLAPGPSSTRFNIVGATLRPGKTLVSEAAAVHPSQIAEVQSRLRERGVTVEFTPTGEPKFTSFRHQRAALRAMGKYNKRDPLA